MAYLFSKLFFWLALAFILGLVLGLLSPARRGNRS